MMEGSLTGFSLIEVFKMVAAAEKTGVLEVSCGGDEYGRACFRDGLLYWAQASLDDGNDDRRGRVKEQIEDAVMEIFEWQSDSYRFQVGETVDKGAKTGLKVDALLMDVTKRQEEWTEIRKEIPSMRAKIDLIGKLGSESITLSSSQWEVISLIGKTATVDELRTAMKCSPLTVCRTLYDMSKMGLIRCLGEVEEADIPPASSKSGAKSSAGTKKYIRKSLMAHEQTEDAVPAEWASYYNLLDSRHAEMKARRPNTVKAH